MRKGFQTRNTQKGNVLFLILIAVMLFGMLTAAITKSEQGTNTMDRERGSISATDVMAYGGGLEKAVARILSDEVSENGLSFENAVWKTYDGNDIETAGMFGGCTTDKCKVFHPAGGGMNATTFPSIAVSSPANTDIQSGHSAVYSMKVAGVGTPAHDLVLMTAIIDMNTCKQINNQLRITNPSDQPPADDWSGAVLYAGSFTGPDDATDEIGDAATELEGKPAGCVHRSGGAYGASDNYFYQVLLPR